MPEGAEGCGRWVCFKQMLQTRWFVLGSNHVLHCENFLWMGGRLVILYPLCSKRVFKVGMFAPNVTKLIIGISVKSCFLM